MKRIIATGFVTALAVVGIAGTASAAPGNAGPAEAACFGQIHKDVNARELGVDNVGQLVQSFTDTKGQGKNGLARDIAASGYCDE